VEDHSEHLFDPETPGGRYELNLEDPYDRMVAWELVDLAWTEEGENWSDETLDGGAFELDEPEPGELWTRDDWQLPGDGILRVTYQATPRIKRFGDVVEAEMLYKLLDLMQHKMVTDYGLRLLKLASMEFWLTAEYAASMLALMRDSESRIDAAVAMLPRVVDTVNISRGLLDWLTDNEYKAVEKKLGSALFHFVQGNPTGHYKLQLGKKTRLVFLRCHFVLKIIILPRQARDKHRESTQKRTCFCRGSLRTHACQQAHCDLVRRDCLSEGATRHKQNTHTRAILCTKQASRQARDKNRKS
jgi:hypothetical protein